MSKKFIALVLFAAMLLSMIPVASAAVTYDNNWPKITVLADGWYAGQNVDNFDITSKTPSTTKTPNYTDAFGNGTTLTKLGSRYLNDKMTDGLKVEIKDYVPGATKVTGGYTVVDKNESFTIKLSGKFSELQPFYYSWLAQQGNITTAVKIPVRINVTGKDETGATTTNVVSQSATISTASGYVNTYPGVRQDVAYITVPLTAADATIPYTIRYGDSEGTIVTVVWDNTEDNVSAAFATGVPSLTVVGVAGDQKENFRADFTQAKWKNEKVNGTKIWNYYPGVLQFNIAAMTVGNRALICDADLDDAMTIKVKALDKNGYPYPQGTIVTFVGQNNQDLYLGSSDKFVTVNGEASYLIDNMGCFNMTFSGIKAFALAAGTNAPVIYGQTTAQDIEAHQKLYDTENNVYLYTAVTSYQNSANVLTPANKVTSIGVDKVLNGAFVLRFSYGNTAEELGFNLKYQNVDRSYSGITLLSDVITVKVGEQTGIPYIVDNPMAMYQGIEVDWNIVNEGIATFGKDVNGDPDTAVIKGVKVGTTYAFCTDYDDDVELVIINVVPADYVEAPVVEPEVEVGTKYVVTASKLNVREGASTSFKKIRQIDRNTVVTGTEVEGSVWVKLNDGGYVHGKYLAEVE